MGFPRYTSATPYSHPWQSVPPPPRLHWGWVLALTLLTRNLFGVIWLLVQATWVRKATGRAEPQIWAIAHLCAFPLVFLGSLSLGAFFAHYGMSPDSLQLAVTALALLAGLIIMLLYLFTIYKLRAVLEDLPVGIPLGPVMTFFFGPVYFQYFLRDWMPMSSALSTAYSPSIYPNVPPQA